MDLYLDPATGDIALTTAGDARLTSTVGEAAAQAILIDLRTLSGEWFLDLGTGLPREVLGMKFDEQTIAAIIRERVLGQPLVASVPKVDVSFSGLTRAVSVSLAAVLVNGDELAILVALGLVGSLISSTGVQITLNGEPIGIGV